MRVLICLLTIVLFEVGCATAGGSKQQVTYPENWPIRQKEATGTCANLTGNFSYFGEKAAPDNLSEPRLDILAFEKIPSVRGDPQYVKINHHRGAGELQVKIEGQQLSPTNRVAYSIQVKCRDGFTAIQFQKQGKSEGTRVKSTVDKQITIASDGSLVVHSSFAATSTDLGIISRSRSGENWYRFPPIKP
jgi:hypothetical protein